MSLPVTGAVLPVGGGGLPVTSEAVLLNREGYFANRISKKATGRGTLLTGLAKKQQGGWFSYRTAPPGYRAEFAETGNRKIQQDNIGQRLSPFCRCDKASGGIPVANTASPTRVRLTFLALSLQPANVSIPKISLQL